jgi:hypothetical protein
MNIPLDVGWFSWNIWILTCFNFFRLIYSFKVFYPREFWPHAFRPSSFSHLFPLLEYFRKVAARRMRKVKLSSEFMFARISFPSTMEKTQYPWLFVSFLSPCHAKMENLRLLKNYDATLLFIYLFLLLFLRCVSDERLENVYFKHNKMFLFIYKFYKIQRLAC